MFRLTREVRFAVNATPDDQLQHPPSNSFGGYPSLTGAGQFFALQVSLTGQLQPETSYLLNIKQVDDVIRREVIPLVTELHRAGQFGGGGTVALRVFDLLRGAFAGIDLDALTLRLSPFLSLEIRAPEHPMVRLSQKFEFSASHRLHNPKLGEEENRRRFGKCNNPHGHGHNYEVRVALLGEPDANGVIIDVPGFERVVSSTVIEPLDHKNLNTEVPQFKDVIPSVENIAMVIYRMLKPKFARERAKLALVTVWETPKTWCEYSE